MPHYVTQRIPRQAQYFTEDLCDRIGLDMILIPGGQFVMGSPDDEEGHRPSESPQHTVTVPAFAMGRYPVTQEQWRVISQQVDPVKRRLDIDFRFRGDKLPVDSIPWHAAVEWCDRVQAKTSRAYRLPSEAEWEYACRAGTTTPFYFGETISTEVANYNGFAYGPGEKEKAYHQTTPVGHFNAPNAFGVEDMHGNIREWCQDPWHDDYNGAPSDGSAWIEDGDDFRRVLRGGSWDSDPWDCLSAVRDWGLPGVRNSTFGFRVVLSLPRNSLPSSL